MRFARAAPEGRQPPDGRRGQVPVDGGPGEPGAALSSLYRLSRFVHEDRVSLDLSPEATIGETLMRLAEPLAQAGIVTELDRFVDRLLERESMISTAVAPRIALPHMRRPDPGLVRGAGIAVGVCREGLPFDSLDGSPTQLFFLLATDSEDVHLALLAQTAAVLREREMTDRLLQARSAHELMHHLIEADYRLLLSRR
jgi:mannitol/fructose-specific phosphotransferase system IIA component (Ntr-type)